MNFLEEKILKDGVIKQGNVLKIDNFLNHQIDINIIRQIASELKRRFHDAEVNKILTIEASGIAIATMLGHLYDVPVVFAKKGETANSTDDKYMSHAYSLFQESLPRAGRNLHVHYRPPAQTVDFPDRERFFVWCEHIGHRNAEIQSPHPVLHLDE